MIQKENAIIKELTKEYSQYIASRRVGEFRPSKEASEGLGRLSRELERKRQVGELTSTEGLWLRQIDELTERILNFNRDNPKNRAGEAGIAVYDMDQKLKLEESHDAELPIIPRISSKEAEKIIEGLDRQFEEKVMNRVRKQREGGEQKEVRGEVPESGVIGQRDKAGGANLQDYLTAVKAERPDVPFSDSDSHFDLSKLVAKNE